MIRLWLVVGVIVALFYVYSVVDCALSDRFQARGLPKAVWVPIVVVFGVIGGVLWFIVGRPRRERVVAVRGAAPDDDPSFLRRLDEERRQQARLRQIERELADLDDPASPGAPSPGPTSQGAAQPGGGPSQASPQKKPGDSDGRTDA